MSVPAQSAPIANIHWLKKKKKTTSNYLNNLQILQQLEQDQK